MDKKIQEIREWHEREERRIKKYPESKQVRYPNEPSQSAYDIIDYLLQQIEIKDKALKEAETFVEELILAVDNCPPRLLDVEEIAQDGTEVINSIAAALIGEDTNE